MTNGELFLNGMTTLLQRLKSLITINNNAQWKD